MGEERFDLNETMKFPHEDSNTLEKKNTEYLIPKANSEYERYVFF